FQHIDCLYFTGIQKVWTTFQSKTIYNIERIVISLYRISASDPYTYSRTGSPRVLYDLYSSCLPLQAKRYIGDRICRYFLSAERTYRSCQISFTQCTIPNNYYFVQLLVSRL